MTVLRRTWLATALFVLVSSTAWWRLIDLAAVGRHLLPTLLVTPLIWWIVVGRYSEPRLWRGIVGGALAGFVSQSAQNIPDCWQLYTHRGMGTGEDHLVSGVSLAVFFLIGLVATLVGALVGLVAVVAQRRIEGSSGA